MNSANQPEGDDNLPSQSIQIKTKSKGSAKTTQGMMHLKIWMNACMYGPGKTVLQEIFKSCKYFSCKTSH